MRRAVPGLRGPLRIWDSDVTTSRAADFAATLRAGYGRGIRRPPGLSFPLIGRSPSLTLTLHRHEHRVTNRFALTLTPLLRRTQWRDRPGVPSVRQPTAAATPLAAVIAQAVGAPAAGLAASLPSAAPVVRILTQQQRVETLPAGDSAPMRPAKPSHPHLPIPHTVQPFNAELPLVRPRTASPAPAESPAAAAIPSRWDNMPAGRGLSPPAPSLAPQEIERIADRVIGRIDKDIVAARERLGRP